MNQFTFLNNYWNDFTVTPSYPLSTCHYGEPYTESSEDNSILSINYAANLNADVDIFSELPARIYNHEHINDFLNAFKNAIAKADIENTTLSKLVISEETDTNITLDWIYNYFRIYFSFDKNQGDHFGFISYDPNNGAFRNFLNVMKPEDFKTVVKTLLKVVVDNIRGTKNGERLSGGVL